MFRPMRRERQAVSAQECRSILQTARRAVLSVIGDDGYPYGVPVNFYYDAAEDTIYIHGAKAGHKLDALRQCSKVCFTTWDEGTRPEGEWAWYVTSVIVFGEARLPDDLELTTAKVRALGRKYYPNPDEVEQEIAAAIRQVQLIALPVQHMTGKRIHER